ncbi:MAG: HD domain-containing protein [Candidatus Komeilibacteria bacterium]|nr:HD domain-containing protein [Candidatus Komeilibacteria bacterium]
MIYDDRVYGRLKIDEPIVLNLLALPQMQRLKKIHQNGIYFYFLPQFDTNRFDHSVGVMLLLKKFNAKFAEQVAGLLHDVSHQVFSHVIDYYYNVSVSADYQDSIHKEVINEPALNIILNQGGLDLNKIGNLSNWPLLDNELPNICADRLDYTLRDALAAGLADKNFIELILNNLEVGERGFIFKNLKPARLLGDLSLKMQEEIWHSDWGELSFYLMGEILKYAIGNKQITVNDFWLGDAELLDKLTSLNDLQINSKLNFIKNIRTANLKGNPDNYDLLFPYKFRVIDPWVKDKRLTELDEEFKMNFETARSNAKIGHYLKFNL